jgi:hypothetical protein
MCSTGADTRYASPTYNPHSLNRRWGLFLSGKKHEIPAALSAGSDRKGDISRNFRESLGFRIQNNLVQIPCLLSSTNSLDLAGKPLSHRRQDNIVGPIILHDGITDIPTLIDEVGIDIVTLAVLSDVPLHRPRRLELEDLVSQWRWLRQVWQFFCRTKVDNSHHISSNEADLITAKSANIVREISQARYNIAIADMRAMFQGLKKAPDNCNEPDQLQFLYLMRLFCPYIGHELLYRYGLVEKPDQSES